MSRRLLLAGLAVLAAAGCVGGGEGKDEPKLSAEAQKALDEAGAKAEPPDAAADIKQVLRERARALEEEDIRALSATASGSQRTRDRRSAKRAKQLAIERIRLVADELETSDDRAEA